MASNILISTPHFLLRYDIDNRQTFVVEDNRREYYGISWFNNSVKPILTHSNLDNAELLTSEDYAFSETGYISDGENRSNQFLSQPHQLLCTDDAILVTNTGRNCLNVVNRADWSVRQYRYSRSVWDRYGSGTPVGNHLNSIFADDDFIYVLANNFSKGSFTIKIDRDTYGLRDVIHHNAKELHNIWLQGKMTVCCDTMQHGLIDVSSETTLWRCEDRSSITRGLAATSDDVFVGMSQLGDRNSRKSGETGFWILDAGTFKTKDYHSVGPFGGVHEIRILGQLDECHKSSIMHVNNNIFGEALQIYWSNKKIENADNQRRTREMWDVIHGNPLQMGDAITSFDDHLGIALSPSISEPNVRIQATLDVSDHPAGLASVVARYAGPDDTNMICALLVRHGALKSRVGLWRHAEGEWVEMSGLEITDTIIDVELLVKDNAIELRSGGELLLDAKAPNSSSAPGRAGVRLLKGEVRGFQVEPIR